MKTIYSIIILTFIVVCNLHCDEKPQDPPPERTRSFILSKDSTFLGAWIKGDVEELQYDGCAKFIFAFSRDSIVYITDGLKYYCGVGVWTLDNADLDYEKRKLQDYLRAYTFEPADYPYFSHSNDYTFSRINDSLIVDTVWLEGGTFTARSYSITESNGIIKSYYKKEINKDGEFIIPRETYSYNPYYFKFIKNPIK